MELIGDCQAMLINVIFSLKLQPFKRSDEIHLCSLWLTSLLGKKNGEREQSCFFRSVFLLFFLPTRVVKVELGDTTMDKQSKRWRMHPQDIALLSQACVLRCNDPP